MAGRPFPPGNNANPKGRPKVTPEAREFKKITATTFAEIAKKYIGAPTEILRIARQDPFTPALELMLISWIEAGIKGDHRATEAYLQRVIGKVPDKVETIGVLATRTDPYRKEVRQYTIDESEEGE